MEGRTAPERKSDFVECIDLTKQSEKTFRPYRHQIQMIFQDPATSLNPQFTVEDLLREDLIARNIREKDAQMERILPLLRRVGLSEDHLGRYPHELSGGQKQRVAILLALLMEPRFVVADEVVSALDLSVQAQILNLIRELKEEYGLTILFISHDLGVVHYLADRILVMHHGKIVEAGDCEQVYSNPKDDYTRYLLASATGKGR